MLVNELTEGQIEEVDGFTGQDWVVALLQTVILLLQNIPKVRENVFNGSIPVSVHLPDDRVKQRVQMLMLKFEAIELSTEEKKTTQKKR